MILKIVGSGSSGNCYILENDRTALILDAGVSPKEVLRCLEFNTAKVAGVLVTHEHGDHSKYAKALGKYGIPVYTKFTERFEIHGWTIVPLPVAHDVLTFSFYINHEEMGNLYYVTDTHYCMYKLDGLNHIMIEANYCPKILNKNVMSGRLLGMLKERIETSHMSIDVAIDWLKGNDLSGVRNIVLTHLSNGNSNEREFVDRVKAATGKPTQAATRNMIIDLNF
jgi:phosphoribosyl 1,2-cyclic phosphodiesterase